MSVIKGQGSGEVSTGFYPYSIEQSLRFNDPDNPYLYRTPSSQGNLTTFTLSFWFKRSVLGSYQEIFHEYPGSGERSQILFMNNDTLKVELEAGNTNHFLTNMVFRDTSAWYNIVVVFNSGDSTSTNRVKIYVNGVDQADTANGGGGFSTANYPSQSATSGFNRTNQHEISTYDGSDYHLDGYLAEVNFIDGTALTASSFGETIDNIWVPKEYSTSDGAYGTNGFYLKFVSGAIGTDSSGNGNNWTHSAGNASRNRTVQDSPTNNFNVIQLTNTSVLAYEHQGMRVNTARTGNWDGAVGSFSVKSGKWYYEVQLNVGSSDNFRSVPGWKQAPEEAEKVFNGLGATGDPFGTGSGDLGNTGHYAYQSWNTQFYGNGGYTGTSISASSGDVINVAVDFDNNKIYFGKNGTYIANDGGTDGDPANGTNESLSGLLDNGKFYSPSVALRSDGTTGSNSVRFNFGSDRSFGANFSLGTAYADENGFGEFRYEVPSGFLALCTQNLPDVDIIDGTENFNTVLYTAASSNGTYNITGNGFQPNFSWVKNRNDVERHFLFDSVRGNTSMTDKFLVSDQTSAEGSNGVVGTTVTVNADGMQIVESSIDNGELYYNSRTYVMWNWLAATAFSNDASATGVGTIDSSGRVNTTAGFSIVSYTGTGSAGTIKHGLSAAPEVLIVKRLAVADNWPVYHSGNTSAPETDSLFLNLNDATQDLLYWNDTAPTSTVFSLGSNNIVNKSGEAFICYAFHSVEGYSKVGSFAANGSTQFVHLGFRPAFVLWKRTNSSGWNISDNARDPINEVNAVLHPNSSAVESTASQDILFVSNGFVEAGYANDSGQTVIYLAFADQPFKFANAR